MGRKPPMLCDLVQCKAPGCTVRYRPHWMRNGACSQRCVEALIALGQIDNVFALRRPTGKPKE